MECHRNHCFLHLRILSFQTLLSTGVISEVTFFFFLKVINHCPNSAGALETRKPGNKMQNHCVGLQKHHVIS